MSIRSLMGLTALVVFVLPLPAQAQEERKDLRTVIGELAKSIKAVAEKENQKFVRIGRFTPTGLDDSNAGDGISAQLAESLGRFANKDAVLEVKGEYGFVNDPNEPKKPGDIKVVKIMAKIVNKDSLEELKGYPALEAIVRSNPDIARMLNLTGRFDPEDTYKDRNQDVQKQQKEKKVYIHPEDRTLISSTKDSRYAVQIRAMKQGERDPTPRAAREEKGEAYVEIKKGELYRVRVLNYSKNETAVTCHIDGIDSFHFSEDRKGDRPQFGHWILPPMQGNKPGETTIYGWHKTIKSDRDDNVMQFLVTENGRGKASQFPQMAQGKVGTITLTFSKTFPAGTARSTGAETGEGPPLKLKQEPVKRVFDPPHDFVTVRYAR